MLTELYIKEFALIEELRLELGRGFTAITGETGAGKSITIDALSAAIGARVLTDSIRSGSQRAIVEASFDARNAPKALRAAEAAGIETDGDGTLILTRILSSAGRTQCRINGRSVPLSILRSVGDRLVDIHGQHEHQALIHDENHLLFLDAFAGEPVAEARKRYVIGYESYRAARHARDALATAARDRLQEIDLLRFQLEELDAAGLEAGEEDTLLARRRRLVNSEKLREGAVAARDLLSGEMEEGLSAVDAVREAVRKLEDMAKLDGDLEPLSSALETSAIQLEDVARQVDDYLEAIDADPDELDEVEGRLAMISRLKRKYGDSVEAIIEYTESARSKLHDLENADDRLAELTAEVETRAQEAGALAADLSRARREAADGLGDVLTGELGDVGMAEGRFSVELGREEEADGLPDGSGGRFRADETGVDRCRFLFSANPGEPLKPLSAVASGGELSRIMLLMKSHCSRGHEIETVVFDEVDAGIGGQATHAVGRKISELSRRVQVLCVTHLPQIARLANRHHHADKQTVGERTVAAVRELGENERVAEIARMLGARDGDRAAREHAAELLADGSDLRQGTERAESR